MTIKDMKYKISEKKKYLYEILKDKTLKERRQIVSEINKNEKYKPTMFTLPKEKKEIIYDFDTSKKAEETNKRLLGLTNREAFVYMFIAEYILRKNIPPLISEIVKFVKSNDSYRLMFSVNKEVLLLKKIMTVIKSLSSKNWLLYDEKVAGNIILTGGNNFIKYITSDGNMTSLKKRIKPRTKEPISKTIREYL